MELLTEITEENLGIKPAGEILGQTFKFRKSARGVVLNDKNEVSLQFVGKTGYYKLPGGGVEIGETHESALYREINEEVGCKINIEKELGITIEYRSQHNLLHISYGYLAQVNGPVGIPSYEQGEIDDGFEPLWTSLEKAIELVRGNGLPENYQGKFIVERELAFLKEAQKILR